MESIQINAERCTRCGRCQRVCPMKLFKVDPAAPTVPREGAGERCLACGHCVAACPTGAIVLNGVRPDTLEGVGGPLPGFDEMRRLALRRRSIRLYQSRLVPREEIGRILDATRWSPTAVNRQQVQWTVVMQPERVKEIAGQVVEFMRLTDTRADIVRAWDSGFDAVMRGAPHLVAAHGATDEPWAKTDCVIATTTFDLLARAAGLGTCWAGFFLWAASAHRPIAEALGLPDGQTFHGGLMVGYPLAAYLRIPERKPLTVDWID
jgi:nitroreductase/NAD-dependent dihydropyrimidine dehydrogenase PreA subunit